jgi:uncharacterized protein YgiM (DUF1202 family)
MTVLKVYPSASWLKVTFSGKTGYVLSHYVITDGNKAYKAGTVTASGTLNVRAGAGTGNRIIGTLTKNQTTVIVSSAKAGGITWYKIRYAGAYGFVDSRYMRKQGS